MIIGHKDHTKYLYHYTSIDKLENYIFKSRKLRFSPYASTNDPKESKDWAFSLHTSENRDLIKKAGFPTIDLFFKWNNFVGFIALK